MKRAESLGYLATCFHLLDYEGDLRRLLKVLHYRGIRGVLLLPPLSPVELPLGLDWTPFSVIAASYAITPLQFHRVVPHQFIDMCRLMRLLEGKGHKRIGAVFDRGFEERIHFHFTAAIKLHGHDRRILRVKKQEEISRDEVADWLEKTRPDAVVCPFALKLQAAMPVQARGQRGPELVSLSVTEHSSFACWDERPAEIGSDAAVLLAGMMQHNETGVPDSPRTSMVHGMFHEAVAPSSTPALPAKRGGLVKKNAA
jgi:DNA-binding LacI/PurR family transcriptional regulator